MARQPGWSNHLNTNRAEDLEWMASTGETTEGAARRLGISIDALEKWCDRQQRRDLLQRLAANTSRPHVA